MSGTFAKGGDIKSSEEGFQLPEPVSFDIEATEADKRLPIHSSLSQSEAIEFAQLIELADDEGTILFYPKRVRIEVGDVLFLRERAAEAYGGEASGSEKLDAGEKPAENGVIVQVISSGTANYPQAYTKALFRLMVNVRASMLERSHHEPPEVIDEFLLAKFKIRASIVNGKWNPPEGRVVTRNVDIFWLDPAILTNQIFEKVDGLNINLGDYKEEPVEFFGGGFEKINLITGMKGSGKSHIAKGIIAGSLSAGISAIVFDVVNEYRGLPNSASFVPGQNLRFRLDRIQPRALIDMIDRIATFGDKTAQVARAELPRIIKTRAEQGEHVPDLAWLRSQVGNIIRRKGEAGEAMRGSFISALEVVERSNLIMTDAEARAEDEFIRGHVADSQPPDVVSLSSVLYNIAQRQKGGVIIFDIGGLLPFIQYVVVDLIIDTLKEICRRQTIVYERDKSAIPHYPTIYFEEAHMYMEPKVINDLLPLIRHHGMNVFFITNTPGELPDSVFRLMDNVIMTRMLNKRDIDQVKNCGLTDVETIEGFARSMREHHALLLSGIAGAIQNFPLVFHVRDFGLPKSGETRSMWEALKEAIINA